MRCLLIILTLSLPLQVLSQHQIRGVVSDLQQKEPISYVNIGVCEKNIGTVSDEQGIFSLNVEKMALEDSVIFSVVGFKKRSIALRDLLQANSPLNITLKEEAIQLQELVFETELTKSKTLGVQKVSGKLFGFISGIGAGAEVSRRMKVSKPSQLQTASIYVRNKRSGSFKLRLNVYRAEQKSKLPGPSLLAKSIILESDLEEGWLNYDFEEAVLVDKSFYISFEWIDADLQNPTIGLKSKNSSPSVLVRPISMGKWIVAGDFDFAIRCEVLSQ